MVKQPIYMAGPMDLADDDGRGWRTFLERNYPAIEWLNPLDMHDPIHDPAMSHREIVQDDKELIGRSKGMIINITDLSELNWGTQQEQLIANVLMYIPNVVVYKGDRADLSPWCLEHADYVATSLEEAVDVLHAMICGCAYPDERPSADVGYYNPYEREVAA